MSVRDCMLNIVVPMAGAGSRFANAGFTEPKPFISVRGVPMIRVVIENLRPRLTHRFVFICQEVHVAAYGFREALREWAPGSEVVTVNGITEGAACTVLAARGIVGSAEPLMIANSDQFVDYSIDEYLSRAADLDGLIMTMTASDPKWSFVRVGSDGLVKEVVEKRVISNEATVGVYNFARGEDFVRAADDMIARNLRVNNEFYVAPVYNQLIEQGKRVGFHNIGADQAGMYGLGTPEDLRRFLANPVCARVGA